MDITNSFYRITISDSIIHKGRSRGNNSTFKDIGSEYGVDIVEISQDAYEMRRLIEDKSIEFLDVIRNNTVDVRRFKVDEASKSLADGVYDRQETLVALSNRLSDVL